MKHLPDYQFIVTDGRKEQRLNVSEDFRSRVTWQHWPFKVDECLSVAVALLKAKEMPRVSLGRQSTDRVVRWLETMNLQHPLGTVVWTVGGAQVPAHHRGEFRAPMMEAALDAERLRQWREASLVTDEEIAAGKQTLATIRQRGLLFYKP